MIKTVAINPTLTPSGNTEFAESVLGRVVEPQTRWSPGSLASQLVGAANQDMFIVLTATQLLGITIPVDDVPALIDDSGIIQGSSTFYRVNPKEGTTKSRGLIINEGSGSLGEFQTEFVLSRDGEPFAPAEQPLVRALLVPAEPTYSALGLLNRLDDVASDLGPYLITLNQMNAEVTVYLAQSDAVVAQALQSIVAACTGVNPVGQIEAAFLLSGGTQGTTGGGSFNWE